jgi:hypothetical protein
MYEARITFRNMLLFHNDGLLTPCQTSVLEYRALSAVCGCLFSIFTGNVYNQRKQTLLHGVTMKTELWYEED